MARLGTRMLQGRTRLVMLPSVLGVAQRPRQRGPDATMHPTTQLCSWIFGGLRTNID